MKKQKNIIDGIYIIILLVILLIPIITFNREEHGVSLIENRNLADLPKIFSKDGKFNSNITSEVKNWVNDHIGQRELLLNIHGIVKLKLMNISPIPDNVMKGKEGWFFSNVINNIGGITGEYAISDYHLLKIAKNQQMISDYYKSKGIQYYLVLTPSKPSIYPEYLDGVNKIYDESTIDFVSEYLKKNTDINIINLRQTLLDAKDKGKLFWKTDTHWNQRGAYYAYGGIYDALKKDGLCNSPKLEDISVKEDDSKGIGDLTHSMGISTHYFYEKNPLIEWNKSFFQIKEGEFYNRIESKLDTMSGNGMARCELFYHNESQTVEPKSILIYGDSQFMEIRNIPLYLSENYKDVSYLRVRKVDSEIDSIVNPDIVLFTCSERLIDSVLSQTPILYNEIKKPIVKEERTDQEKDYWIGNHGFAAKCNGNNIINSTIIIDKKKDSLNIEGWAADFMTETPLSQLYAVIGDKYYLCNYGIDSPEIAKRFNNENYSSVKFNLQLPVACLNNYSADYIEFVMVSKDEQYQYKPLKYKIQYK